MKLKSFGCSFISGTDLCDAPDGRQVSQLTWPALLAKKFNLEYNCQAGGGQGNLAILDRLSQEICRDSRDVFVVQWTYIDRFDFSDPHGHHFSRGENDWDTILPGVQTDLSELYFRTLHSEYRDKLTSLIYVKIAIDLLLQFHCKFIMTYIDQTLLCDRWHISSAMRPWQKYIKQYLHTFEGLDFLSWSQVHHYPISKVGHPLQEAHKAAANLMEPHFQALL